MTPTELHLYRFVQEHHPEMLADDGLMVFIRSRADDCAREYETQVNSGVPPLIAGELANGVLFEGLNFCPCAMIQDVIEDKFSWSAPASVLVACYRDVKHIFDQYPCNDAFMASVEYDELRRRIEQPVSDLLQSVLN